MKKTKKQKAVYHHAAAAKAKRQKAVHHRVVARVTALPDLRKQMQKNAAAMLTQNRCAETYICRYVNLIGFLDITT